MLGTLISPLPHKFPYNLGGLATRPPFAFPYSHALASQKLGGNCFKPLCWWYRGDMVSLKFYNFQGNKLPSFHCASQIQTNFSCIKVPVKSAKQRTLEHPITDQWARAYTLSLDNVCRDFLPPHVHRTQHFILPKLSNHVSKLLISDFVKCLWGFIKCY
jgi:hypothetical protein